MTDTTTAVTTVSPPPRPPELPANVRNLLHADRVVTRLLEEHPELAPGLHLLATDDHGHPIVHYTATSGSSTVHDWTSPDGLISAWRQLLTGMTEDRRVVDREVPLADGDLVQVQDKVNTLRGTRDGVSVTVLLTVAGGRGA